MKTKHIFLIIALVCILFLVGCHDEQVISQEKILDPEPTNLETPYLDTTKNPRNATTTRMAQTIPIVTPTVPTTNISTMTITPQFPTFTPLPTLSSEKANELVLDLMKNNAGCKLPCFWGIVPGETPWHKAQHFLASFAERIDQGQTGLSEGDGVETTNTNFVISNTVPEYLDPIVSSYLVTNGIVNRITVFPRGTDLRYQLYQVLTEYEAPDEVLLLLSDISPNGKPWFQFFIFYVEQGITLIYKGAARFDGNVFEACPKGLGPELILISPGSKNLSLMKRDAYDVPFRIPSINDFPGKDINFFYETMKTPDACLRFDPTVTK